MSQPSEIAAPTLPGNVIDFQEALERRRFRTRVAQVRMHAFLKGRAYYLVRKVEAPSILSRLETKPAFGRVRTHLVDGDVRLMDGHFFFVGTTVVSWHSAVY